jgi:hypothetical protein
MNYGPNGMPHTVNFIKSGTQVLYTNGNETWSGVVTRVDHGARHFDMGTSWAWVKFDGIVVPESYAHGICGPGGISKCKVDFDKLTLRQVGPDDESKRAIWAARVAAHDAQLLAISAAAKADAMELYSYFRPGQHVSWNIQEEKRETMYSGIIETVDLANLCATVTGSPKHGYTRALIRYTLGLNLLTRMYDCNIDCIQGTKCGSAQCLAPGTKDIWSIPAAC